MYLVLPCVAERYHKGGDRWLCSRRARRDAMVETSPAMGHYMDVRSTTVPSRLLAHAGVTDITPSLPGTPRPDRLTHDA